MRIFLYVAIWTVCCACSGCQQASHSRTILPGDVHLRAGDVVLRRGTGFTSRMVMFADKGGAYSHVGIVVADSGRWMVVHAVPGEPDYEGDPDRVKMEPAALYFAYDRAAEGCVMRCADSAVAVRAALYAKAIYRQGMLFDHAYDDDDTTTMYCCELVEYAYRKAGMPLVGRGQHDINMPGMWLRHVMLPSDFIASGKLHGVIAF